MDIGARLISLGLGRYAATFHEQHVDASLLQQLTADDLIALGVASVGHRRTSHRSTPGSPKASTAPIWSAPEHCSRSWHCDEHRGAAFAEASQ